MMTTLTRQTKLDVTLMSSRHEKPRQAIPTARKAPLQFPHIITKPWRAKHQTPQPLLTFLAKIIFPFPTPPPRNPTPFMALPKSTEPPLPLSPTHCYTLIPCDQHEEGGVVLPFYRHPTTQDCRRWPLIIAIIFLLLLATLVYVFWPSDPTVKVVRLRLNKIHIHTLPIINIDISLYVTLKVRNVDVYSMDFRSLDVAVKYRGKRLGHVRSDHGHVRALGSSYVNAEVDFCGISVLSDVVSLLDDLARGTVPFDTITEVSGRLGLLFFGFPLKAKLFCAVLVNINNQTIVRQTCYPESEMNLKP